MRLRPEAISRTWFSTIDRWKPSRCDTIDAISARNGSDMIAMVSA